MNRILPRGPINKVCHLVLILIKLHQTKMFHVSESPACGCGFDNEDTEHYLLQCPLHLAPRQLMLRKFNTMNIGAVEIND